MDAIDQLALLHKAISGAEMPGHKYKSRKRKGNAWVYEYGDKKGKPGRPARADSAAIDAEFDALDARYDITSKGAAPRRAAFEAQVKRLLPGRQVTVTNRSITVTAGRNSQRYPLIEIFEGSEDMNLRSVAAAFKEMANVDVPKAKSGGKKKDPWAGYRDSMPRGGGLRGATEPF